MVLANGERMNLQGNQQDKSDYLSVVLHTVRIINGDNISAFTCLYKSSLLSDSVRDPVKLVRLVFCKEEKSLPSYKLVK
jgi:hypothetical protein